jgi:hypothetical protein
LQRKVVRFGFPNDLVADMGNLINNSWHWNLVASEGEVDLVHSLMLLIIRPEPSL